MANVSKLPQFLGTTSDVLIAKYMKRMCVSRLPHCKLTFIICILEFGWKVIFNQTSPKEMNCITYARLLTTPQEQAYGRFSNKSFRPRPVRQRLEPQRGHFLLFGYTDNLRLLCEIARTESISRKLEDFSGLFE